MAKKSGAFWGLLAIGAAVGTYAYLQKKNQTNPDTVEDDDDLDNFDAGLDEEDKKRTYTSLNFSDVEKKVTDAAVKFADSAEKVYASASEKLQTAAGKIEEFFDDRKPADADEAEEETEEEVDPLTKALEEELDAELNKENVEE